MAGLWPVPPIPGALEKGVGKWDPRRPYREPTLVPWVRSPRRVGVLRGEGTRQISPVTSGEGVPAVLALEAGTAGRSDKGVPAVY